MKHHYVPACYLRGFTDPTCPGNYEPYLWVVDLDTRKIRRQSPKNTAHRIDYYKVGNSADRYDVEKYFSQVESDAAPVLSRMLGDYQAVEPHDKRVLSHFAALQMVRVPRFREGIEAFMTGIFESLNALMIQSRERYEAALRETFPDRTFTTEEVDRIYAGACDVESYSISANPEAALGHALNVVPKIADLLNNMSWAVMEPAGAAANYWSSDNPLYYINPHAQHPVIGHGLMAQGTEVNLPIGPRRCLFMAWSEVAGPRAQIEDIRTAQERGIAGAKRYLFCSTEQDALEAVATHRRLFPRRYEGPPVVAPAADDPAAGD